MSIRLKRSAIEGKNKEVKNFATEYVIGEVNIDQKIFNI